MKLKHGILILIALYCGTLKAQIIFELPKGQSRMAYLNVRNPLIIEARGKQVIQNILAQEGTIDTLDERVFYTPLSYRSKIFISYLVDGESITDSIRPKVRAIKPEEIELSFKPRRYHFNFFAKPLRPKQALATLPSEKYGYFDPKLAVLLESIKIEVHNTAGIVKVFKLTCKESGEIIENQEYLEFLIAYSSNEIKLRVSSVSVYADFWPNSRRAPYKVESPKLINVDFDLFLE